MKKKLRKQIHKEFPWYDHTFLLELMYLWTKNASKLHRERGHLLRSDDTSRKLKLVSDVLRRIIDDEYDKPCKVFQCRNKIFKRGLFLEKFDIEEDMVYLDLKYQNKQRQADVDFVFSFMAKNLQTFWD